MSRFQLLASKWQPTPIRPVIEGGEKGSLYGDAGSSTASLMSRADMPIRTKARRDQGKGQRSRPRAGRSSQEPPITQFLALLRRQGLLLSLESWVAVPRAASSC